MQKSIFSLLILCFGQLSLIWAQAQTYEQVQTLMETTNEAYMAGDYPLALDQCRLAERMSWQVSDYPQEKRANIFRSKAHVFMSLGELDSGIVWSRHSLSAYRESIGPAERLTIDLQYELAYFFDAAFVFDSAIYHYEQCIDLYKSSIGDSTDDVALTHNRIANINMTLGLLDEAEPHAKEAYRLWIRNFGQQSPRGITASRLLGKLHWTIGRQSQGLLYYEEAVRSATAVYQNQASKLLPYYSELSKLYHQMGFQQQYLEWFERADSLANVATQLAPHQKANFYHIKAKYLHDEHGQSKAGINLLREAIDIYQTIPFKQKYHYVNLADFHTSLAQLYKETGQYDTAYQHIDYAYAVYDSLYPTRRYYGHFERLDIAYLAKDTTSFLTNASHFIQFLVQSEDAHSLSDLLQQNIQAYPEANTLKAALRLADRLWQFYEQYPSDTHLRLARLAFEQLDRWYDPYHREEVQYAHRMAEHRSWI
ncbi:MAG: tetratricopeptide repeat protein [Bacteroidia bacterium]